MRLMLFAALALAACATAGSATEPAPTPSAWVAITPAPIAIDGRAFTPTCSDAPDTDPSYRFWFRQGSADGLVVFFDGGGACWDDVSCAAPWRARDGAEPAGLYKAEIFPADGPARFGGIFDARNARNPLRDWSFVYVPYCTGDVHAGSNTAHYTDPDSGAPFTIEHRGADNFRVILAWMRAHVPQPEQLLVAGSSAGAYGAAAHFAAIRESYPGGSALMFGDAGQGVTTPDFLDRQNRNWNYQVPASVFGAGARLSAEDDVVARLAAHFPRDRFAQYTTSFDVTQRGYYALIGAPQSCGAWTEAMHSALTARQSAANFRSYLAAGETHTILRSRLFYVERSAGAPFAHWLTALLSDAAPASVACENCLTPPARCDF
jgi:Pectinacetylesterase